MVRMNMLSDALGKGINNFEKIKRTVFVPRSRFKPFHHPKLELAIQEDAKFAHTYLEQNPNRKPYVIHDGPPFANGPIHLGHAVNKILKDIAARYAMITGHKVEFITGWDCHGLPIELQVYKLIEKEEQQRQSNSGGSLLLENTTGPEHFRTKARAYAKSQIDLQMASFKRMGLLTDWNKRYTTDDPSYVANQLRAFSQLYEQKLIFRDLMPVHWSLVNKTPVAEADIDYKDDHISTGAYVLYEIVDPPFFGADLPEKPVHALVWTTTPWTLLENRAIAFNKHETYGIVSAWKGLDERMNLLVSFDAIHKLNDLLQRLGFNFKMQTYVPGRSLIGLKYKPLLGDLDGANHDTSARPFLDAEFVDGAKGTGLVHTAPNYGFDDFTLIRKNGLPIEQTKVDHGGKFRSEAGHILSGKHIFSDGTQEILSLLDQHKALLLTEKTQHSYPYESRTNQPAIIRTSQQIFLDTSRVIPRCLKALEACSFFPESRRRQLINLLSSSPSWCISRQRLWGTPIPVVYEKEDTNLHKMITHPTLVEHFCKLLYKRRFMDYWWTADNSEVLPQEILDKCKLPYKSEDLVRGMDIFDVWSDSGLSWHTTVHGLNDTKSQADLYLEGTDQIRGWFSSSSILSMALRGCLPTKRFFLHGFALAEDGRKMSKSEGNVLDPVDLFQTYGVDPVRLWAAKTAGHHNDILVNQIEFDVSVTEIINKIRNTLKFLIGALADHDAVDGMLDHTKLELFDQYYLDRLYRFASTVDGHYKNYRYDLVAREIHRFIISELSPVYFLTIKDVLYCDETTSAKRRSCLTVLNLTYNILLRCVYPITPHIVHDAAKHMRSAEPLNEWSDLGYKASWKNDVLNEQMEIFIKIRGIVSPVAGEANRRGMDVVLYLDNKQLAKDMAKTTNSEPDLMVELFRTSTFNISHKDKLQAPAHVGMRFDKRRALREIANNKNSPVGDDSEEGINFTLITAWVHEVSDGEYRIGGSFSINNEHSKPVRFELCYRKSSNRMCIRCRRYTVLDVSGHMIACDRCRQVMEKMKLSDV